MTAADHANTVRETPPGWKLCPHCMGSGLVQADDMRPTTSPLDALQAQAEEATKQWDAWQDDALAETKLRQDAEAERDRLADALRQITHTLSRDEARLVARAALAGEDT